jgi:hypothetical protein
VHAAAGKLHNLKLTYVPFQKLRGQGGSDHNTRSQLSDAAFSKSPDAPCCREHCGKASADSHMNNTIVFQSASHTCGNWHVALLSPGRSKHSMSSKPKRIELSIFGDQRYRLLTDFGTQHLFSLANPCFPAPTAVSSATGVQPVVRAEERGMCGRQRQNLKAWSDGDPVLE